MERNCECAVIKRAKFDCGNNAISNDPCAHGRLRSVLRKVQ
jgi:hypothetical protein